MNTYTKLRSGEWGVRVDGKASAGTSVTIVKRDGGTKTEIIARVLWTGVDKRTGRMVSLCAIGGRNSTRTSGRRGDGRTRCVECGGPIVDAAYHAAMDGYCGRCAFDEFDC